MHSFIIDHTHTHTLDGFCLHTANSTDTDLGSSQLNLIMYANCYLVTDVATFVHTTTTEA